MELLEYIGGAPVVALLGMCKNAGKTTALNVLIREYAAAGKVIGMTSIGRDGESRDLVTDTYKPPIYMYEGMLAATAEQLLPFSDVSRELLELPELYTSLGRIVLFRARSDGFVQLAGPAIVEQLAALRRSFSAFGAECVLIDGALSRRSPAAGATDGCCILSTGASLDMDVNHVVEETGYVVRLLTLPEAAPRLSASQSARFTLLRDMDPTGEAVQTVSELNALLKRGTGDGVYVSGALTEAQGRELLRGGGRLKGLRLIADDGSRWLLQRDTFARLEAMGVRFAVRRGCRLAAVTVNPVSARGWQFDPAEFLEKMRAASPVPVVNVGRYHGTEL